jgi:hypothetical protein
MARYREIIPTTRDPAQLAESIREYLRAVGFTLERAEQNVWRKGGLIVNPQFIRFEVQPGALTLEAWVSMAILPGVNVGEFDLEGWFLFAIKIPLKGRVAAIAALAR